MPRRPALNVSEDICHGALGADSFIEWDSAISEPSFGEARPPLFGLCTGPPRRDIGLQHISLRDALLEVHADSSVARKD